MTRNKRQRTFLVLPKIGMFLLFVCIAPKAQSQQCNCGGPNTTVNLWTDDFGTGGRVPSPNATLCYEDGTGATNCGASWSVDDGDYTVHNTTAGVVPWPAWSVTNDHTGGGLGRMMVVNAGAQGQTFYTVQVPVQPGCNIDVSFWVKNVINIGVANHILPDITLRLLDTLGGIISSVNTGPVPQDEQWYQYSLSVNPGVNSAVVISLINNLPPGNGNDFVLDDISMNQTYNIGPTGDFTFQTACSGFTTFTSTASSFTTGYAWDFNNDGVIDDTSPNPSFTYASPGSYLATLTVDDGLCSYAQSYTVVVPVPPNAGIDASAALCGNAGPTDLFNLLNGTPDTGGTWSDPNGAVSSGIFNASTDPLGSYTYVVSAANGCPPDSATVLVSLAATAYAGIDGNMSFCSNDPAVQLSSLLGGSPDPGGNWSDTNGNPFGPVFDPSTNASGTYTYLVPAINACGADSATVSIQVNTLPDAGISATLNLCSSAPPAPLFNALNGTPDIGGTWTDPANLAFNGMLIPSTASSGSYTYTVAGTTPCAGQSATVTVSITTAPDPGIAGTVSLCSTDAAVQLDTYLGGTPDAGGTWSDPNSNAFAGTLDPSINPAGVYTYTVTGTAPCADESATVTVTINTPPDPGIDGAITLCSSNAAVLLAASLGGSPDAGGTWTDPNGNPFAGTLDPSVNLGGVYTYTVLGNGPCLDASATVTVTIIAAPNPGLDGPLTLCSTDAAVLLNASLGGTPDVGGAWSDPNGNAFPGSLDPNADPAGVYTYTVTGTAPCADESATVTVSINTPPDAGIDGAITLCSSDAVVQLAASLGGTPDAGGTWTDPNNAAFNGSLNPSTASAGSYTYTVTGSAPCPDASAVISVFIDPASNAGINDSLAVCIESDPIDLFVYLGNQADSSGVWTDPQGAIFDGSFDVLVDSPGVFTYVILGTGVCPNDTAMISVSNSSNPVVASFIVGTNNTATSALSFTNTSQQATEYLWDFAGLASSTASNPSFVFPIAFGETYEVCLQAWNNFGCADTLCQEILSLEALDVWVPNAFTPDGTGINETFGPVLNGTWVSDYAFTIFNRWGELVFESADPFLPWDGTYMGSAVEDGVYVWRLTCRDTRTNQRKELMGHVMLMR